MLFSNKKKQQKKAEKEKLRASKAKEKLRLEEISQKIDEEEKSLKKEESLLQKEIIVPDKEPEPEPEVEEVPQKRSLFSKLKKGLAKTKDKIFSGILQGGGKVEITEETLESIEEKL